MQRLAVKHEGEPKRAAVDTLLCLRKHNSFVLISVGFFDAVFFSKSSN